VNPPTHLDVSLAGVRSIGVLSDTHIPHRLARMPDSVYVALAGCDIILHAGDLEDPAILKPLRAIAPVYAVRGNLHWQYSTGTHDQELSLAITLRLGAHVIWLTHGHFSFAYSVIDKFSGYASSRKHQSVNDLLIERLRRMRPPEATAVVFGHSHLSVAREIDGVMYFNPGSVASQEHRWKEGPRIGRLTLGDDGALAPEWIDLI
jgi:uncharacterized protein